ncbi:MAG: VWA domain-containing protein [Bacteroidales bacterium]
MTRPAVNIIFLLLTAQCIYAQPKLKFEKHEHDFGRVANLDYPPAVFEFSNSGNEPLAILMVRKSTDVKVNYESKLIHPGEQGKIFVLPDLNRIGPFEEKIIVVSNTSEEMAEIIIKGTVTTVQECFPNQTNMEIREVNVHNKITKEPVANAHVEFILNIQQIIGKTDYNGKMTKKLKTGQYHTKIEADDYHTLEEDFYLRKSVPVLFFELDPLTEPYPATAITLNIEFPQSEPEIPDNQVNEPFALPVDQYAANNLVLLVDVSLSMKAENKLELMKAAVNNLVTVLRRIDNVSVISYAEEPVILLRSVDGSEKDKIIDVINNLAPAGITNGVKGLNSAYNLAQKKYIQNANNQIILATDGKFTGGNIPADEFSQMISGYADQGITISIIGFGLDEKAITFMKEIATYGRGKYIHVKGQEDISNLLIDEIKANSFIGNR